MRANTEKAFEIYIQETMASRGWVTGSNALWDVKTGLFPDYIFSFLKDTQGLLWEQMEKMHRADLRSKLLEALIKERDIKGTLHVIRHGFKFYGKTFQLAYFKPAH